MPEVKPLDNPLPEADRRGRAIGTIHQDAVTIRVRDSVLEEILDYSEQDVSRERGGFLIGVLDSEANSVDLRHFLPAEDTQGQAASLRFTHETWSALTRDVERRFPRERVVGWQHTHPNLGVFLSGYDLFIHRNFFREPWQVALVVDPVRHEFRFFQWRSSEVVDCGFLCTPSDSRG